MKKILVIGAGFSGVVIARQLAEAGYYVDVVESRDHIGGNAYDFENEFKHRVHKYGPHIFHTKNAIVYNYLSKFTTWEKYYHIVKALTPDNKYLPFPPNRKTCKHYGFNREEIVDIFFRPYTKKMWGLELEEISPDIINRVPIDNDTFIEGYFRDKYQVMPKNGYTELVHNILDHKNIKVVLNWQAINTGYGSVYEHVFNSAPIDAWYKYEFGKLPYRSIKFKTVTIPQPRALPSPVVNFTHEGKFTRVTEWKQFVNYNAQLSDKYLLNTTLTYEEPCDYKDNNNERYYPVKDINGDNRKIYKQYDELSKKDDRMTFIGRCGKYAYIDMDQSVNMSLQLSKKFIKTNK